MEVSIQLQVLAATAGEDVSLPFEYESGWNPESVWVLRKG